MYYRKIAFIFTLILSVAVIYFKVIPYPFVFDDNVSIVNEKNIRMSIFSFEELKKAATQCFYSKKHFRPVVMISFALNYYIDGFHPQWYHIVNILIHILAGISLFFFMQTTIRLASRLSSPANESSATSDLKNLDNIAFFSTLIWMVNPVNVQAVTYVTQRMTSMMSLFFLLSLLFYARGRMSMINSNNESDRCFKTYIYFFLCGLIACLAIGSKETAIMLPLFIFLYEWFFFQNLSRNWLYHCYPVIIAICLICVLIAYVTLGDLDLFYTLSKFYNKRVFTMWERILTEFRVILYYINLFIFPHPSRLTLDHDFSLSHSLFSPLTTLFCLITIICILFIACIFAKKERILSYCILWYFGNLAIESSFIWLEIIYEYRMYLSTMLICLPCLIYWFRWVQNRWIQIAPLCLIVLLYANWTYTYNQVWKDPITLFKDCVAKAPDRARPYCNLGHELATVGKFEAAEVYLYKAVQKHWHYATAHYNLASVLEKLGKLDQAIIHYKEAIKLNPTAPKFYNLGVALSKKGLIEEATIQYHNALKNDPEIYQAHFNLAILYKNSNHLKQSLHHFNETLRIKPNFFLAHKESGLVLQKLGKIDESIYCYNQALSVKPDDYEVHYQLGNLLAHKKKFQQAVNHYINALKRKPEIKEAHNNLGFILFKEGHVDNAIHHFKAALQIDPNYSAALKNLNIAKLQQSSSKVRKIPIYEKTN